MLTWFKLQIGNWLIRFLTVRVRKYEPFSVSSPAMLRAVLQPGDVLLVEGTQRFSVAIKYLTQSTWSHAALFVGDIGAVSDSNTEPLTLIEADLEKGVHAVPLSYYEGFNTRVCRPVGLLAEDIQKVVTFMVEGLDMAYDLKNVIDLVRYLVPAPPVPVRWRRRMLALGSGDPTRAICSTHIAQAFQSVGYPILPYIEELVERRCEECEYTVKEILHIRHHSLFTPRDFDLSPYFMVIKPTMEQGFDYRRLLWGSDQTSRLS